MSLKEQRVMKGDHTGVILDEAPDEHGNVRVHWGYSDKKLQRTVEHIDSLTPIDSPPLDEGIKAGWMED